MGMIRFARSRRELGRSRWKAQGADRGALSARTHPLFVVDPAEMGAAHEKLDVLLPALYLRGISTGDFQEVLTALLGKDAPNLSPL